VFDTSNTFFGKDSMTPARADERAARDLLRHHRCRVHVHHRPGPEALVAAKAREHPQQAQLRRREKKHILDRLTAAEGLERFLHTKYVGQKRFSLEGGESFIAAMDELIQTRRQQGRAGDRDRHGPPWPPRTCWSTPLGKMPADLFAEFDHTAPEDLPAGDVKYHQGFSSDVSTPGGPVHLSLGVQPLAPGDRQPGGRGLGARRAWTAVAIQGQPGAARAGAR